MPAVSSSTAGTGPARSRARKIRTRGRSSQGDCMAASRSARGQKARKGNERQSELPLERAADPALGPCPRCGKHAGEFKDGGSGRFRYLVICGACAWSPGPARIKEGAAKLWNEAKPLRE